MHGNDTKCWGEGAPSLEGSRREGDAALNLNLIDFKRIVF